MPRSCLWAISRNGHVFSLHLETLKWKAEKTNVSKQSFKKISAQVNCAWGIGADQRMYMTVFSTDIPIRAQVSCFENQRWSVMHGWSENSVNMMLLLTLKMLSDY